MKTVGTLNTSGYEDSVKAISNLTAKDLEKGIYGQERNGNFIVYGNSKSHEYVIVNKTNGIEINKSTVAGVKKWLTENAV